MAKFLPLESKLNKLGFLFIAGIDEAGRGPMAGPVVSAAVILKPNARIPGLDDSKKLTAKKREQLFEVVLKNALHYAIAVVSHKTIDKINILKSVQLANDMAVNALEIQPHFVLIDGKDKQIITPEFQTVIKGDSRVKCIAAASILAKVTRDKIMEKYADEYTKYGFAQHKGYGTRMHRSLMEKHGLCDIHRKSYTFKV